MEGRSDKLGTKTGMWLFLYTEIMLFGGLFVIYANYHHRYKADFVQGGESLNTIIGAVNTAVLLISSCAVASSITGIRRGNKKATLALLGTAIALGFAFLVNKYFEWSHKFAHGIYPNSPTLADGPHGLTVFYGLYYTITGLHALHVIIGMVLLSVSAVLVWKGRVDRANYVVLDNSGLYWHLVDLIWIFIFPLFYLIL